MNKKEIKEKLNNIPKDEYIYQRYKGIITKYIQKEGYYIDCATGIGAKIEEHLLLGKTSKNLIDLIEVGDIVNGFLVLDIDTVKKIGEGKALDIGYGNYIFDDEISTILTKESYMANCYKVGGKDDGKGTNNK